jgi:hypothetical protein
MFGDKGRRIVSMRPGEVKGSEILSPKQNTNETTTKHRPWALW